MYIKFKKLLTFLFYLLIFFLNILGLLIVFQNLIGSVISIFLNGLLVTFVIDDLKLSSSSVIKILQIMSFSLFLCYILVNNLVFIFPIGEWNIIDNIKDFEDIVNQETIIPSKGYLYFLKEFSSTILPPYFKASLDVMGIGAIVGVTLWKLKKDQSFFNRIFIFVSYILCTPVIINMLNAIEVIMNK